MEYTGEKDNFLGKTIKIGNSLGITIPQKNVDFSGLQEGDNIKIWYQKVTPTNTQTEQ